MADKKQLLKSVAAGTLCGLLSGVILMSLLALALTKIGLLNDTPLSFALAALLAVAAAAGGFVAAKLNKGAALIAGALTGAAMFMALTATSMLNGQRGFSALFAVKLLACLLGGAAGGVLAVRDKQHLRL